MGLRATWIFLYCLNPVRFLFRLNSDKQPEAIIGYSVLSYALPNLHIPWAACMHCKLQPSGCSQIHRQETCNLPSTTLTNKGCSFSRQRGVSCSLFYLLLFVPLKVISFCTWFVIPVCIECVSFRNDLFVIIIMHSTYILLSNKGMLWGLTALLLSLSVQQLLRRAVILNYNIYSSLIPCCLTSFG